MKNRIPREFFEITGEMLIKTNVSNPGDILRITKEFSYYRAYNERTKKYAYVFADMLRNPEIFHITEIIK